MAKPRITANQVTFLRLALIPIPCWLLYQGEGGQYAALILATLLGCTDFVDGYLARKYGPTKLGGLMDPIADKVFIAITFLPAVDLNWVPAWLVALLFAREFVVTAARTIYESRGQTLKSTYLARYKTWVQMCGIGFIMLMQTVTERTVGILLAIAAITPILLFVVRLVVARKRWKGAAYFAASFAVLLALHRLAGSQLTCLLLMYFIVGVTLASGLGYLLEINQLRGKGAITAGELVRLLTALALPFLAVAAQTTNLAPKWALITLISLELAHGGLDNLLAHHHAEAGAGAWALRVGGECALVGWGLVTPSVVIAQAAPIVAVALGAIGLTIAFAQKRRFYLDEPTGKSAGKAPGVVQVVA